MASTRQPALEREEIFDAANRLEADGKDVTALALLDALGRGSLSTIYRYMAAWQAEKPATSASDRVEIPESVESTFRNAWYMARQEAAREVEVIKEKAAQDVRDAKQQFDQAIKSIEKLEKDGEAALDLIEELKQEQAKQNDANKKLGSELAAEKAKVEELRQQLSSRESELKTVRKEMGELKSDRDGALKEAAKMSGKADTLQDQNKELLKALSSDKKKK